jgi:hypothetical protein
VKPADILMRLGAQFDDETLSRNRVYYWNKSFKKAGQRLKTCEDYTSCRERHDQCLCDDQGVLFVNFLIDNEPQTQLIIRSFLKTE